MPNGKPGDHPMTDWARDRDFKFPGDLEMGLRELLSKGRLSEIPEEDFLRWAEAVKTLEFASETVRKLLLKRS